ncbi:acetylxylan esterase [Paenibacillus ginsengarvi]
MVIVVLKELLNNRNIMPIWNNHVEWIGRKKEIIHMLCEEEYGFFPLQAVDLSFEVVEESNSFCAGKVALKKVMATAKFEHGNFSFPFYAAIPQKAGKHPFFVLANFRDHVPDQYLPSEEVGDHGFGVLSFCYKDVSSDNNDWSNGLAGTIYNNHERCKANCGKIAMWAWAASRVLDYAYTQSNLDVSNAAVIGHSRLGKTALLAGALDERFTCVISNNSGCSGAAISRNKNGETIENIYNKFPYWFCDNYEKYKNNEGKLPFDQHFLLAAIAPRKVYVASAVQDLWADPESEYLSCVAASEVYEKLGLPGFVHPDRLPQAGDVFHAGHIGYHLRSGGHYLSREDWLHFIHYLQQKA